MVKYHIKDDGNPGFCKAEEGACPKGGAHFDSVEEARNAVEELFGNSFSPQVNKATVSDEPIPAYTKAAMKTHWYELDTSYSSDPVRTFAEREDAFNLARDIRDTVLNRRLSSKSQNDLAKKELAEKLTALVDDRNGDDEGANLDAAAAMAKIMPVLEEHYGVDDPRTPAQKEADVNFVAHWQAHSVALNHRSYYGGEPTLEYVPPTDLDYLVSLEGTDPSDLTVEQLEKIQSMNPHGDEPLRRWGRWNDEKMTSLDFLKRNQALKAEIDSLPASARPYLQSDVLPEKLEGSIKEAINEIITIAPSTPNSLTKRDFSRGTNIFEAARRTQELRANNTALENAVLNAKKA